MPENSLAGLNARVTGSGRGIGKAIALALGKKGANVSVHSLHATDGACETIDAVLHERVQAMAMQADLSLGRDRARVVEPSVAK
jgi:3-oxoacyl-[acyl-carrier protein] reductase